MDNMINIDRKKMEREKFEREIEKEGLGNPEELLEKIKSGEIKPQDHRIKRINSRLAGRLVEILEELKKEKEENKEPELSEDDKFFEAVRKYTSDFKFLFDGPDIVEGIEGHKSIVDPKHKERYTKLILKMLECKKELDSGRFESEEQFLRRIVELCNEKHPEKKETAEYRIYAARLEAIKKQKEDNKYYTR